MSGGNGLRVAVRAGEWHCNCSQGIRAASCAACVRCGARRPLDTGAQLALTQSSLEALGVYEGALTRHGNKAAAMGDVIVFLRERGTP